MHTAVPRTVLVSIALDGIPSFYVDLSMNHDIPVVPFLPLHLVVCPVQVVRDYQASCRELQSMLLMLRTRSRAATSIQSAWRGWHQRRQFAPVWQAHLELKQQINAAQLLQQVCNCSLHPVACQQTCIGAYHQAVADACLTSHLVKSTPFGRSCYVLT
jgi:hypothetical protein